MKMVENDYRKYSLVIPNPMTGKEKEFKINGGNVCKSCFVLNKPERERGCHGFGFYIDRPLNGKESKKRDQDWLSNARWKCWSNGRRVVKSSTESHKRRKQNERKYCYGI